MDTFSAVIDTLGGSATLSKAIQQEPGTVRQWRFRDNIPPEYWPGIVSYAKRRGKGGITAATLAELAASKKSRAA
jgi:hypothetical protein